MQTTVLHSGEHGAYRWLSVVADAHIEHVLYAFPEVFFGRFLAITAADSGALRLDAELMGKGWRSTGGIVWTPAVRPEDLSSLRSCCCGEYDEWYIFAKPRELGSMFQGNPLVAELGPGNPVAWVNFPGFALHEGGLLREEFWNQLAWIQPETYICDGRDSLNVATRDSALFERVRDYFANLSYT